MPIITAMTLDPVAPRASIVVPLSGDPTQALRCLEGIALQPSDPSFEVIVVDDASADLEALLARLDGDVTVLRSDRRIGFGAAAVLGAQSARADTVVLIRGGAAPAPGWLAPLVAALQEPSLGLAASASVTGAEDRRNAARRGPGAVLGAWSAAVRTADLRDAGCEGLDDRLVIGALALSASQRGLSVHDVPASTVSAPETRTGAARRAPGEDVELTIVIPTLDACSERIRGCLAAIATATEAAHEIVIVDNGAPPQGFSAPVNAGLRAVRTPYAVVMNDDVEPLPGWWEPLRARLDAGAAVAFPLTIDGAMRTDFAAWCFAIGRDALREFAHAPDEFFDPSMVIWFQDTDLLQTLQRAGRPPVLVRESKIRHGLSQTLSTPDPRLSAWVRAQIEADQRRFVVKHPDVTLIPQTLSRP
jgi:GT2 family glycosyltransferase